MCEDYEAWTLQTLQAGDVLTLSESKACPMDGVVLNSYDGFLRILTVPHIKGTSSEIISVPEGTFPTYKRKESLNIYLFEGQPHIDQLLDILPKMTVCSILEFRAVHSSLTDKLCSVLQSCSSVHTLNFANFKPQQLEPFLLTLVDNHYVSKIIFPDCSLPNNLFNALNDLVKKNSRISYIEWPSLSAAESIEILQSLKCSECSV
jgi:hypothetical protein